MDGPNSPPNSARILIHNHSLGFGHEQELGLRCAVLEPWGTPAVASQLQRFFARSSSDSRPRLSHGIAPQFNRKALPPLPFSRNATACTSLGCQSEVTRRIGVAESQRDDMCERPNGRIDREGSKRVTLPQRQAPRCVSKPRLNCGKYGFWNRGSWKGIGPAPAIRGSMDCPSIPASLPVKSYEYVDTNLFYAMPCNSPQ